MKKLYWRPSHISRTELALVAVLALAGLIAVESFPLIRQQPHFKEKTTAARLSKTALQVVKEERLRRNIPIYPDVDPAQSGLIGDALTPITSTSGHLGAKQTTINPNFAALIVHYLTSAGVEPGDVVALGVSGSFPAINLSTYAALETLKVRPIVIASAAASQFGATHPRFTWLDMERRLQERNVFSFRSVAASRGGIDDRGLGLSAEGKRLLDRAIARNELPPLEPESYENSVELRMSMYDEHADGDPVAAYINVGGGTASVGTSVGKKMFEPGLNREAPRGSEVPDSVMLRFARRGAAIIHMVQIIDQAREFGFSVRPTSIPAVGQGEVFRRMEYNPYLTAAVLIALLGLMFLVVRLHLGVRLKAAWPRKRSSDAAPTEMV